MDWQLIRLAVGAFLTSPGFAGLAALGAAALAFRGVTSRIAYERGVNEETRAAERSQRWWSLVTPLMTDADGRLPDDPDVRIETIKALQETAETRGQIAFLRAALAAMEPGGGQSPRKPRKPR